MGGLIGARGVAAFTLTLALAGCSAAAPPAAPMLVTAWYVPLDRAERVEGDFVVLDDGCVGIRKPGETGRVVVWQAASRIDEHDGRQRIDLLNGSVTIGEAAIDAWGVMVEAGAISELPASDVAGIECLADPDAEVVVLTSLEDFLFQQ